MRAGPPLRCPTARTNRRLTRTESRYHSGESLLPTPKHQLVSEMPVCVTLFDVATVEHAYAVFIEPKRKALHVNSSL